MDKARTVALIEGLAAVIVWGASFIATKLALRDVGPLTLVWLRFAIGVLVLGVAVVRRREVAPVKAGDLAFLALLGAQGITFHQWLQSTGLQTSQASTSGWIIAATPAFMAVLGVLALRERLSALQVAGIVLAGAGVVLVVTGGHPALLAAGRLSAPGDLLIVLSSPNWAVFSILSRRALTRHPAARMTFLVMAAGWLLTGLLLARGPGLSEIPRLSVRGWVAVVFLGVLCSGLAYIFWNDALQRLPASQVGALLYLEPLVAQAVAYVVLGEPLHLATLGGGAVILLGVFMVNRFVVEPAARVAVVPEAR
jgi:drug/metabolite transporter (DMT)-like permease